MSTEKVKMGVVRSIFFYIKTYIGRVCNWIKTNPKAAIGFGSLISMFIGFTSFHWGLGFIVVGCLVWVDLAIAEVLRVKNK